MTPPLDAWHGARCGRSSIFRERGGGDRSLPTQSGREAHTPWEGLRRMGEGATCCGHSNEESRLGGHLGRLPRGSVGSGVGWEEGEHLRWQVC